MAMFGGMFGGNYQTPPYAGPQQADAPAGTGMPTFQPPKRGVFGTAGLIGDVLTDSATTRQRLDGDFQFAQQQFQQAHPGPVNVGGNLIDPATGKVLFAKPQELTGFAGELQAAGYAPGSPDFLRLAQQHATNAATAPPIVQHNADGTTTLYQAGMVPRTPTNAPAVGSLVADPRKTGGTAPSTGPGGFPFYRPGH